MVFKKYNVRAFLAYGAVLGAIREGDFIKWDDDIDLAIVDPIDFKTRKDIGWDLLNIGFHTQPIAFNVFGRMEQGEHGYNGDGETGIIVNERGFKFSIFFYKETECEKHGREYVCIPKLGAVPLLCTPLKFYTNPDTVKLHGEHFMVPGPVKEYLEYTYGDYMTPKKENAHAPQWRSQHEK